jgi:hypothetical protein
MTLKEFKQKLSKLERKIKYELGHYLSERELKALIQKIKFAGYTIENNMERSYSYIHLIGKYIKSNSKLPQKVVVPIEDYINKIEHHYKTFIINKKERK